MGSRAGLGRRGGWLGVLLVFGLGVSGCAQEVPLLSEPRVVSSQEFPELALWAAGEVDKAIDATGIPEGWYDGGGGLVDIPWDEEQHPGKTELIRGNQPLYCGERSGSQVVMILRNTGDVPEPFVIADRVRALWEAEGWTISNVLADPPETEAYFRADRAEGGHLSFQAAENWLIVAVYSPCSVHRSVVNRHKYYGGKNPFGDELERREQDGE